MKSSDLPHRTRPRLLDTPLGQICNESTSDIYRVYWPQVPLPGVAKDDDQQKGSGAGIEMMPLKTEPSHNASVIVNVNSASQ